MTKNNKITWLIDKQVIPIKILNDLKESLSTTNSEIIITDLSDSSVSPTLPNNKFFPYGSTNLIKYCLNNQKNNCYLFTDDNNFSTKEWVRHLGSRMLNHDAIYCRLQDVFSIELPKYFFIKPDSDLKSFTGSVVQKEGLDRFYNKVNNNCFDFDLSIPIVVSPSKNTGWEWRLVMIKDKVIASSSYKLKSMLNLSKDVPEVVIKYAQETAKIWHPKDIYVMDVCESEEGLKVVEFNCINASGLYNCDIFEIVSKINEYITEN